MPEEPLHAYMIWKQATNTSIHGQWRMPRTCVMSNVNLGYTFDRKKLRNFNIQSLRLYFTGSNLFVWTPYSGFDPEVSTKGNNLTPGVDYGAYPRNRSYVFGLNITF